MNVRTLNPKSALPNFLSHIHYTQSRLLAKPQTAALATPFQALRAEWSTVQAEEIGILEAISAAQALVDEADDGLDDFASRLSKAVLVITKDDRQSSLYLHFFGKKSLSEFARPTLGGQLEAMRPWVGWLQNSQFPTLQAMSAELAALIAKADQAIQARDAAQQQNRHFRDVGARRQFVDKLNAARKEAWGALAKMPFVDVSLPSDFADHFFRNDGGEAPAPTVASVTAGIADLEKQLAAEKGLLTELQAEADAAAKAAAEQQADEAALTALQKQMADLAKQADGLKQKLAQK